MKTKPVYIVLPPRESFSSLNAGAVAIVVHSMCEWSSFHTHVIGSDCAEPFSDCHFTAIKSAFLPFKHNSWTYARSCKSFLQQQSAGIVEVHNRIPLFLYLSNKLKQHVHCLYLHNDPQGMKGAKTSHERQMLLEKASAIYVVSEYIKSRFMEGLSGGSEKLHVIYNGVNFAQQVTFQKKKKQIIFVGRVIPEKGVLELAKAFKTILPNNLEWTAVFIGARHFGNTKPTTEYERKVLSELESIDAQVEYKNALPYQEVMEHYRAASIAVVPSIWNEPFGRTALEAIISHCALVCSERGGLKEVVGDTVKLIDPEDPGSIALAVQMMIDNPEMRNELKEKAYKRALGLFDQSAIVRRHDAIRQSIFVS